MACLENDAEDLSYKRPFRRDILTCSQRTVHEQKSINRFLGTAPGGSEPISRRHRLDPDGLSLTLRAGSGAGVGVETWKQRQQGGMDRSEEHTSELQSLMRISYAVFCLKKKKKRTT